MKKYNNLYFFLYSFLALYTSLSLHAATYVVDLTGTYTNILDAVTTASSGDIILLTAGQTFSSDANRNIILTKNLTFDTTDTASAKPIVDLGKIYNEMLFTIDSTVTVTINNLDIRNGAGTNAGGPLTNNYGAIINNGKLTITKCNFSNNEVSLNGLGGGIYNSGTGTLTVSYCSFIKNSASNFGGAIYNEGTLDASVCIFYDNAGTMGGGAIATTTTGTVSCSNFVGNTATNGSAIFAADTFTATNNWWGTNYPDAGSLFYGTVNYSPWITMSLVSTHPFIGENALVTVDFASSGTTCTDLPDMSVTFTTLDGTVTPTQSLVIDGTATATFVATNTTARVCAQVDSEEECVYTGPLIVDLYGTYTNIQAAVNDAQDGDTIYITAGQTFTGTGNYGITLDKNITFTRTGAGADPTIDLSTSVSTQLFTIDSTCTVSISNLNIINGSADGGAIWNNGTLTAMSCTFSGNISNSTGGAILNNGTLTAMSCTFSGNSCASNGGAIFNNDPGLFSITDCAFIGNSSFGSAIYSQTSTSTNYILNCTFSSNGTGSAIVNNNIGIINITSCTFSDNSSYSAGGVLYNSNSCITNITDCTFRGNSSNSVGGVIFSYGTLNVIGCTFSGNSATDGGAIYAAFGTISCSRFVDNTATSSGSAIYSVSNVTAENNWWGTNEPSSSLFYNTVSYIPYITMSLSSDPATIAPGVIALIIADFTQNSSGEEVTECSIPAMPVGFDTTEGTLTATLANTIDGIATSTLTANYSGLTFILSVTAGPGEENYSLTRTFTPSPINPGILIVKKINSAAVSTQEPGVVVASDSMMDISYIITNTGNVTLNVEVTDDQGYEITPSTATLVPDASITCTTQTYAPDINQLHKNIGTATGTTALSTVVTASAPAYATSIPVNPYRYNFGCICSDEGEEHILIGSHNMPELDGNSLDFWMFNETPTVSFVGSLDLGQQIIMDSATYNTESGMNIAVLTQTQEGDTAIILITYDGVSTTSHSITPLSSQAFKAQWFVSSSGTPYIVTDEQNGMSLYEVDLNTYEMTLSSSVPNLGTGTSSMFLRWYPQGDSLYVIQGYNQNSIATYKVDLSVPEIQSGVANDLSSIYWIIHSCATCYENLVLGGGSNEEEGLLMRCAVEETGDLAITQTASIPDTFEVYYCERCCCDDNPILAGTDNGLYSLNANTLDVVASNTSMSNNVWINTCWCCDVTGDYCISVDSNHDTFVFQQVGSALNMMLELPN